MILIKNKLIK